MTYAELAKERDDLKSENAMLRGIMDKMLARGKALKEENERIKEDLESLRNDLINAECNLNHVTLQLEEESKRTATEILKKLNGFRFVMYDEGYEVASWICGEDDVKQFAKEIGV